MDPINTYEAKKNFSSLLRRVRAGETVIIASHNKPVAELRPVEGSARSRRRARIGLCKGQFRVPDNFNDPLSEEILKLFHS